jgi:hypothetical protein
MQYQKSFDVYTDIQKQEGSGDIEQRFVLWLHKRLKKSQAGILFKVGLHAMRSYKVFHVNPETYRNDSELKKPR